MRLLIAGAALAVSVSARLSVPAMPSADFRMASLAAPVAA
jgi:hypothetical protein